jgi:hypothetical protein
MQPYKTVQGKLMLKLLEKFHVLVHCRIRNLLKTEKSGPDPNPDPKKSSRILNTEVYLYSTAHKGELRKSKIQGLHTWYHSKIAKH